MSETSKLKELFESCIESIVGTEKSSERNELKKLLQERTIIAGGAVVSLITGRKVNDLDLYFKTREDSEAYVRLHNKLSGYKIGLQLNTYTQSYDICGIEIHNDKVEDIAIWYDYNTALPENNEDTKKEYLKTSNIFRPSDTAFVKDKLGDAVIESITEAAISLKCGLQIILKVNGEVAELNGFEKIIDFFDFEHVQMSWDPGTDKLDLPMSSLVALAARNLYYSPTPFPVSALFRVRKYLVRDYKINAGELLKIAIDISELDLGNPEVLRAQLIGVDIAYFKNFLTRYNEYKKEHPDEMPKTILFKFISDAFDKFSSNDFH